jgi:hypothetical protein
VHHHSANTKKVAHHSAKTTTSKHHHASKSSSAHHTTTTKAVHHAAAAKPTTGPKDHSFVANSGGNGDNVAAFSESNPSPTHANNADSGNGGQSTDAAVVPAADPITTTDASAATPSTTDGLSTITDPNTLPADNTVTVDNLPSGNPVNASVSNKTIGISVGAAIGCVAAVGLAGMMVYKRQSRRRFEDSIGGGNIDEPSPQTHWRPTSFMAAVTSVVARLPRDRHSSSSRGSGGFAASVLGSLRRVRSGRSNRSSSGSEMSHNSMNSQNSHTSFGYAVSGPVPELARVDNLDFHEVDLRAR